MILNKKFACLYGFVSLLGVTSVTQAGFVPPITDPSSRFSITYDDSQTNALSIWGMPSLSGGSISFSLPNYDASVNGPGNGVDAEGSDANDIFKFKIIANADRYLTGFQWSEGGKYSRTSSDDNLLRLTAGGQVIIDDLGSADRSINTFTADLSALGVDLEWGVDARVAMSDFSAPLTEVEVSLENDLLAALLQSGDQDVASVAKLEGVLQVSTRQAVPVPPTIALLIGGFLAYAGILRRHSRARCVGPAGNGAA